MNALEHIKRAPKWAWLTAAGVGIGAGAIKIYKGRDNVDPEAGAEGDIVGGATQVGGGVPAAVGPGVIVPPVIMPQPSGDSDGGLAAILAPLVGGTIDNWSGLLGNAQSNLAGIAQGSTGALESIALAGGPSGSVQDNPTPIVINVPIPQAAPKPLPVAAINPKGVKRRGKFYQTGTAGCYEYNASQLNDGTHVIDHNSKHLVHKGKCQTEGYRW